MTLSQPHLAANGVAFTVSVEFVKRQCIVSADALTKLSELGSGKADLMHMFLAHEANIAGVARRLVAAGVSGTPLQLDTKNFGLR
jgi:hypothetical protein